MSIGNFLSPLGGGNMIDSWLHPERGYKAAADEMQKYYKDAQGNLQPYNQNGQDQYGRLNNQAGQLGDPATLENQWASGYTMSPYAKQLQAQAQAGGLDAASSMGLMGSSGALSNIQNQSANIMQADRQNYMKDLMDKYMASVGIGQNIYGTGANAANSMSTNAMNMGQNMGQSAFGQQNAPGAMFGDLLGKGINAFVNYKTGGIGGK